MSISLSREGVASGAAAMAPRCLAPMRLAVLCDYPEEGWASMDLVAEMVLQELHAHHGDQVGAVRVCPPFRRRPEDTPDRRA